MEIYMYTCIIMDTLALYLKVAARVFLGARFGDSEMAKLMNNFQIMQDNMFTVPLNLPGTGYHQVIP